MNITATGAGVVRPHHRIGICNATGTGSRLSITRSTVAWAAAWPTAANAELPPYAAPLADPGDSRQDFPGWMLQRATPRCASSPASIPTQWRVAVLRFPQARNGSATSCAFGRSA